MKIIVGVSLVPDSTTKVKVGSTNKAIDETGVTYIINPYDEFAVEEAVQLKEKNGGEVIAVSFGTDKAKEAIKKAFQMGCDKGVLIKSADSNFDTYTVAKNLADYIKTENPDLVLFGKQSIDYDGLMIPPMVGELLGIPSVNVVVKLDINGKEVTAEREIEGGKEVITTTLPAVIGTQKGINNPRYPNLKSIMASKSKPIEEKAPTYSGIRSETIDMKLPAAKGKGKVFEGASSAAELVKALREEAKVI